MIPMLPNGAYVLAKHYRQNHVYVYLCFFKGKEYVTWTADACNPEQVRDGEYFDSFPKALESFERRCNDKI